jgi:hypothetical protein
MQSLRLACVLVLVGLAVTGCSSGSGGSEFLSIVQTAPEDGQVEVPIETRVGFRVDQAIDPATLTTQTFFLTDGDGTLVPSMVFVGDEPEIAELQPEEPLAVITDYTLTITTALASTNGTALEEDFQWTFKTLDSEWGISEWLEETGTGGAEEPQIAVDGQSNALAVWEYAEPGRSRIWANRYTRRDLWGDPVPIDAGDQQSSRPQLAVDEPGNSFVVWEQTQDGSEANIWSNRYTVDQGWGTAELLQTGEITAARVPSIAADPAGNAIAVWVQVDPDTNEESVWASRYEPDAGWGAAASIDATTIPLAGRRTAVAMDSDGNAIAVWDRPTVGGDVLWANRYTAGSGWGTAQLIKDDPDTSATGPRLSMGRGGDAVVVWAQGDDTREDIWAVRFSGSTWEAPVRIDAYDDGNKNQPDVAVDGAGMAHAVWSQADPDFENIWAASYTPGSGWGTPELIEPPNEDPEEDGDATVPRIGVNTAGNAFVVWRQVWDNWGSVWSNRLDPGTGWMTAERIEDIRLAAKRPKIAVDENRHAHAVWLHSSQSDQTGSTDWVRTNRFE